MSTEMYVWEAWLGQKITKCESFEDGRVHIQLEDGRGAIFSRPLMYTAQGISPLEVAETKLKLYPAVVNGKRVMVTIPED